MPVSVRIGATLCPTRAPDASRVSSYLMDRARERGAAADGAADEGRAVSRAVRARLALRREIAGMGAAASPEDAERVTDRAGEPANVAVAEGVRKPRGLDAGA